jgi:UDP-3-O-[3-hydroxymyristoyl] glucosamine N-acyltransferase
LISLKELANKVNGHLIGDGTIIISNVDDIHSASNESIAFAFVKMMNLEFF